MKRLNFAAVLASVTICTVQARPQAVVVCEKPKLLEGGNFEVPIKITNTSKEAIGFLAGGMDSFDQYAARSGRPNRWKNITPSMRGMCALGYVPGQTQKLAPGESFRTTEFVSSQYAGWAYVVSVSVSRADSMKRGATKVRSGAVFLR